MIKVNLLKTQLGNPVQNPGTSAPAAATAFEKPEVREALVKGAVVSVLTICLYVYESQNLRTLAEQHAQVQARVTEMDATARAKTAEVESVKDVANQARELEDKLKILKLLSRLRLREVKTIEFMQSSILVKVWLKNLEYEAEKEDVARGHLLFKGNAVATEDLTEFTKRLEDSAYLEQVITVRNQEIPVGSSKSVTMREFEFTAQVEVKN